MTQTETPGPATEPDASTLDSPNQNHHDSTATAGVTPYAGAWQTYNQLGWPSALPLPLQRKRLDLIGYTGYTGRDPSYADMYTWGDDPATNRGGGNICLRLPDGVVGIDIDNYDGKPGAATIAEGEKRCGALPPAPRATSRDDEVSGIRLYRVPAGTRLKSDLGSASGVEIIQRHHRYAVVWPSIHPEGRLYRWLDDAGNEIPPPTPDDLPDLPPPWLDELRDDRPVARDDTITADERMRLVDAALTAGEPTSNVANRLRIALEALHVAL